MKGYANLTINPVYLSFLYKIRLKTSNIEFKSDK